MSDPRPSDPAVAGSPSAVADAEFALLLTHDVDRPYKSVQSVYHAVKRRNPLQLRSLLPGVNPWWQFEDIMEVEASLGVRSAFYFLREQHLLDRDLAEWFNPFFWVEHAGRYEVETPRMADLVDALREGGWEVGLHGSYGSYDDPDRLRTEKTALETVLGEPVRGGRQHYLNVGPNTWRYHRDVGLQYDASLGSSDEFGFEYGYRPLRPFDDEFVVFPLTLMEAALPDPGEDFEAAWAICEELLVEAADNDAVMSVLWHPRTFTEADFPGYRELYRRLVETALEMGAWVGPPADYYDLLDHPGGGSTARSGDSGTPEDEGGPEPADPVDPGPSGVADPGPTDPDRPGSSRATGPEPADRSRLRSEQADDNKVRTRENTESTG